MTNHKTVPAKWVVTAAFLAGLALVPGAPVAHAAGAKVDSPAKGGAARQAVPAKAPDQASEDLDPDEKKAADEAFEHFQATVDVMNGNVKETFGGPPFPKLEYPKPYVVKVIPSASWMKDRRIHYRNAIMLYRMWRNANQFRPVTIMITDDKGGDYMTLKDTPQGLEYRAKQE
jgi:hypothetical protein